jgi:hypothetical protein
MGRPVPKTPGAPNARHIRRKSLIEIKEEVTRPHFDPAFAVAFLSVIPAGNLLLLLLLPLPFCLSFPEGICFCFCCCLCFSVCHSRRESASAFAVAFVFLSVIPEGNLLLLGAVAPQILKKQAHHPSNNSGNRVTMTSTYTQQPRQWRSSNTCTGTRSVAAW